MRIRRGMEKRLGSTRIYERCRPKGFLSLFEAKALQLFLSLPGLRWGLSGGVAAQKGPETKGAQTTPEPKLQSSYPAEVRSQIFLPKVS